MKRALALAVGSLSCGAVVLAGLGVVRGAPPSGSASAPLGASASAAPAVSSVGSVKAPVNAWAEVPWLADVAIPTVGSEKPKRDAWKDALPVRVVQRTYRARSCKAVLLREYLRVSCDAALAGVRQFVGGIKDVEVFVTPKERDGGGRLDLFGDPKGGDVVFPLRRGESYLFQFFTVDEGYEGFGVGEGVIVDVSWSGARPAPTVVLR